MWDVVPETVKELTEPYLSRFAFFCLLGFLVTFLTFFSKHVIDGKIDSYISLDSNAGLCKAVPKSLTQSVPFVGASTGVWQGNKKFEYKDGKKIS